MDLQTLQTTVHDFAAARGWPRFHTPKNLAMALMVEAAELLEIFQWLTPEESQTAAQDPARRQHLGEEVADVLIYLLQLAGQLHIDVPAAVLDKLRRNAVKYPAPSRVSGLPADADDVPTGAAVSAGSATTAVVRRADTHVLLDFENVQPSDEALRALVPQASRLWVFHGPHQKQLAERFASFGSGLTVVPIAKTGKNALDFHLSFYMGYIAARHPDARFVVVANDKGYEPMLEHARLLDFDVQAVGLPRTAKAGRTGKTGQAVKAIKAETTGRAGAARKASRTAKTDASGTPAAPGSSGTSSSRGRQRTRAGDAQAMPSPQAAAAPVPAAAPAPPSPTKRTAKGGSVSAPDGGSRRATQGATKSATKGAKKGATADTSMSASESEPGRATKPRAETVRTRTRATPAAAPPAGPAAAKKPRRPARRAAGATTVSPTAAPALSPAPTPAPSPRRKAGGAAPTAQHTRQTPVVADAPKTAAPGKTRSTAPALDAALLERVTQGLNKLGSKRPTRLARLRGVLKSFLGSNASEDTITRALGRLIATEVVDVDTSGQVSYPRQT
jgi:NTP pyrophosphatase (non-canonical NTP hydrolase)